jgi:hypothetical protein
MYVIATPRKTMISSIIINSVALLLIYFTPALSHLLNFPLYLVEPMRLMIVLAMLHSDKRNAFILAATLPLFSFAISAHPVFYKMLLISAELIINVWLFYALRERMRNNFTAMISAIVLSKAVYYLLKSLFISAALLGAGLFSTPIWIQGITTLVFGAYAFAWSRNPGKGD